jgi:hypothetical protein
MRSELIYLYNLACANPNNRDIVIEYSRASHRIGPAIAVYEALDNDDLRTKLATSEARCKRLEEAITPSAETRVAYMGEFSMSIPEFDEHGKEYMRNTNIPWTTIKDIMKAISRRALEGK